MFRDNERPAASSQATPTAEQLWHVMDFAHRFPDLTRQLAAVLIEEENQRSDFNQEDLENFVFPPLKAPDPRAIKARAKKKVLQRSAPQEPTEVLGLSQEDLAPESISILPDPPPSPKKKKRPLLSYLFTAALVFFLLWFYGLRSIYQYPEGFDTLSQVLAR